MSWAYTRQRRLDGPGLRGPSDLLPPARRLIYPCQACSAAPSSIINQSLALRSLSCSSWHMQPTVGSLLDLESLEKSLPSRCWVAGSLGRSLSRDVVSAGAGFPFVRPLAVQALPSWAFAFSLQCPQLSLHWSPAGLSAGPSEESSMRLPKETPWGGGCHLPNL